MGIMCEHGIYRVPRNEYWPGIAFLNRGWLHLGEGPTHADTEL